MGNITVASQVIDRVLCLHAPGFLAPASLSQWKVKIYAVVLEELSGNRVDENSRIDMECVLASTRLRLREAVLNHTEHLLL